MEAYQNFKEASISCIVDCINALNTDTDINTLNMVVSRLDSIILAAAEHAHVEFRAMRNIVLKLEEAIDLLGADEVQTPRSVGRPPIAIDTNGIESLLAMSFKGTKIAEIYGISIRTLHRRMGEQGLSVRGSYSNIADEDLAQNLHNILLSFPNTGYKRMRGFLLERGIKVPELRVRNTMREVDPQGVYQRTRENRAIVRRQYFVRYSNQLWHLDTNLKLIRWKIVIRGALDGKSRNCIFLDAGGNNTSHSNLESFLKGVQRYGVPFRCRSDKGGENVLVARFMLQSRGLGRASHICGRSVHNQRIERFWKDLGYGFISFYRMVFIRLEDDGLLNIENPNEMKIFHRIFLPRINAQLQTFMDAWNHHPLSTEANMTPQQLFFCNLPPPFYDLRINDGAEISAGLSINSHDDLQLFDEEDSLVNPMPMLSALTESQLNQLNEINPLDESESYGCDLYQRALQCLLRS